MYSWDVLVPNSLGSKVSYCLLTKPKGDHGELFCDLRYDNSVPYTFISSRCFPFSFSLSVSFPLHLFTYSFFTVLLLLYFIFYFSGFLLSNFHSRFSFFLSLATVWFILTSLSLLVSYANLTDRHAVSCERAILLDIVYVQTKSVLCVKRYSNTELLIKTPWAFCSYRMYSYVVLHT